ncbi:hypothetical protein SAMN05192574_101942 [Mucilaginibacter gossypiicola]|uniref:Uncharacterized protein n=2 Tax=Mucilaginibacter gossypiicola TaxID=551995 RepID=A0A1H8BM98_9SPHI|nr:hypothetical protein SAMN05192574_101942 [Mucilaginibacter gossypiicola]
MEEVSGRYKFTPPDGNLEYDIMPLKTEQVSNLMEWIKAFSVKDLQASGYSEPSMSPAPIAKYVQSAATYTVMATDQQNKKWGIMYIAYKLPDNAIRLGKVIWAPGAQGTSLNTATRHFAGLMKQETQKSPVNAAVSNAGVQHPVTTKSNSPRLPSPTTAPGKGLSAGDIAGMALHSETGIGVGGMVLIVWRPYLLLKNGMMYQNPDVSPYDLDVAKSKEQEPEKWGTWKINGKIITVNRGSKNGLPGKPEEWKSGWWTWATPATPNEKLNASYNSLTGGGNTAMGGGSITVSSTDITFNNSGQFTYESTGGGSYNGSGANVTAYSSKNKAGNYKLDGYCIELNYNNGNTTRQSFYFFSNDKKVFGIATRAYIQSEKTK